MKILTIARGDDWNGLYVGEDLVNEGHSFSMLEIAKTAMTCGEVVQKYVNLGWLSERGSFPLKLSEVVFD